RSSTIESIFFGFKNTYEPNPENQQKDQDQNNNDTTSTMVIKSESPALKAVSELLLSERSLLANSNNKLVKKSKRGPLFSVLFGAKLLTASRAKVNTPTDSTLTVSQ